MSDGWGATKSFPIAEVWQSSRKNWDGRLRLAATWLAIGTGLGAIVGSALTGLLLR